MKESLGQVGTGPATTLRLSAVDAAREAEALIKKETQAAESIKVEKGQIKYFTVGEPVFNCVSESGRRIKFMGGVYVVSKDDADYVATVNALDYHVKVGTLKKEEFKD